MIDRDESRLLASDVYRAYGSKQVLRGASLHVGAGQIVGLLGANGAGKTTFLSIATGMLSADRGEVRIAGLDLQTNRRRAARELGSAPQELGVYPMLSVRENLITLGRLYGVPARRLRGRSQEVMTALGLDHCARTRAEQLSGGQRRRLHTGMALMHAPRMLFLDEPTVGADVESRRQIVALVQAIAATGTGVLYTTHHVAEMEEMDAHVAVLTDGRINSYGSAHEVIERWGGSRVRVRVSVASLERFHTCPLPGWTVSGSWLETSSRNADPTQTLAHGLRQLHRLELQVQDVDIRRSSLESAYLRILQHESPTRSEPEVSDAAA